jgi:hypothetical protein
MTDSMQDATNAALTNTQISDIPPQVDFQVPEQPVKAAFNT